MYNKVLDYVKKHGMFTGCGHVVAGLSGGADSVCLLMILKELKKLYGFGLTAVHVHHGIRGDEADRDMEFCRKLCENNGIDYVCKSYDVITMAKDKGISTEEMGRIVRYNAFNEILEGYEDGRIAVAHHANDRAETVIFNLSRGTGIRGLTGIRPVRDNVIRPLLCCTKDEIIRYLEMEGVEYCEDSTNSSYEYTRNRIRHNIIPELMGLNDGAVKNICAMSERMQETDEYFNELVEEKYNAYAVSESDGIFLKNTSKEHRLIRKLLVIRVMREVLDGLKDVADVHIEAVVNLMDSLPGAYVQLINNVCVRRDTDGLFFYKEYTRSVICIDVEVPSEISVDNGKDIFAFQKKIWDNNQKITNEVYTKCFDYDKIKFGLQLRTRREGDYLVVDDAGHRKKLNRYFIDEKIPGRRRDEVLVLADGDHIMWVVGGRISEEYKVTEETGTVLIVKYGG